MALTFEGGKTWVNGDIANSTNLNLIVNGATYTGSLEITKGGTGANNASDARTNLGLGTISTQAASAVAITGGSVKATQYEAVQSTTTTTLDFSAETEQAITLSGNANFTTSNLAAGRHKLLKILCDGTNRVIAFPAGWTFVGSVSPTSILANKTALVAAISYSTADSGVVASYIAQP